MSTTPSVLGSVVGAAMSANPLTAAMDIGKDLIDRFIPDPAAKAAATAALQEQNLQLALAQINQQTTNVQAASANIQKDGLSGPRVVFCYAFVALLIWNYAVVPMLHKPVIEIPLAFTIAFTTLLLGTSAMNIGQNVALAPGDSSINILGLKLGNKS